MLAAACSLLITKLMYKLTFLYYIYIGKINYIELELEYGSLP